MANYEPIAWAYDADIHCNDCKYDRFSDGRDELDMEGNDLHPIFSWDENLCGLYCGDCLEAIEEHPDTNGKECSECGHVFGDPPDDEYE